MNLSTLQEKKADEAFKRMDDLVGVRIFVSNCQIRLITWNNTIFEHNQDYDYDIAMCLSPYQCIDEISNSHDNNRWNSNN